MRQVAEVRAFNRCYTGVLGLLDERQLESPFTLTEMRMLYEICGMAPGLSGRPGSAGSWGSMPAIAAGWSAGW